MLKRYLFVVVVFATGYAAGLGTTLYSNFHQTEKATNLISARLREEAGRYTNPLLMCDVDDDETSERHADLETQLRETISEGKKKNIDTVAVYFRDFTDSSTLSINPEERFTPASLNKVPLMITLLEHAEEDENFLKKTFVYHNLQDANAVQMIKPKETLLAFSQYTIEQALEMMIWHSDNAAYDALTDFVDYQDYLNNFRILRIPTDNEDGMNVKEYSYFLRVLYNSTLLSREMSEKALGLLTQSTYSNALRSGLPNGIDVAHKFGVSGGVDAKGNPVDRQLHDCGVVYIPQHPYLLCVMTKSSSDLSTIESFISQLSRQVYTAVVSTATTNEGSL